jgi:hypothetical protein
MLSSMRKTYDTAFKAKVAFTAVKGEKTIAHITSKISQVTRLTTYATVSTVRTATVAQEMML